MKKSLVLSGIFLLLLGCSKTPEERINDLFEKGITYIKSFEFDKASSSFKEIGNIKTASPLVLYGEGLIYECKQQYYDALSIYLVLNDARPSFEPAFAGTYRAYTHLKYYDEALEAASKYKRLLPDTPSSHQLLAEALLNVRQFPRARLELEQAVKTGAENVESLKMIKARIYLLEGKLDSAKTIVNDIFPNPSLSVELFFEGANYFELAGFIDSAITLSQTSYELSKSDFNSLMNHFYRLVRNKYFYNARKIINKLKEENIPSSIIEYMKLYYNSALGDKNKIRLSGLNYRALEPTSLSATVDALYAGGQFGDLLTIIQDIGAYDVILEKGNYAPEFIEFFNYVLTKLYSTFEKDVTSLSRLKKITGQRSNRKEVKLDIALTHHIVGEFDKSMELLKLLERYHSLQVDWLTGIADVYCHQGIRKYNNAERLYKKALEIDKWYRPAFDNLFAMFKKLKKYDRALEVFEHYPHFVKNNPEIALLKAFTYFENDNFTEGFSLFEKNIDKVKGNIQKYTNLVSLLEKKERHQERKRLINLLKENNSDNPDALIQLAKYFGNDGYFDSASVYAEKALAFESDNPNGLVQKTRAIYYLGEKTEAIKNFEDIMKKYPENVENLYYFSRVLADEKIDFNRASNIARKAVFNGFGAPKYLINLSYIYYQMERYNLSRGEALKARNADRTNPVPYFRIGLAMYMEGKEEAKENLQKALDLGLKGADQDTALYVLSKL